MQEHHGGLWGSLTVCLQSTIIPRLQRRGWGLRQHLPRHGATQEVSVWPRRREAVQTSTQEGPLHSSQTCLSTCGKLLDV